MKENQSQAEGRVDSTENLPPSDSPSIQHSTSPSFPHATPLKIPPILFEGDEPEAPPVSEPAPKYALGPTPPAERFEPEAGELPEAYGTGKLLLIARDPHSLYAHWDLTPEQQRAYNAASTHHHLAVRIYPEQTRDIVAEVPVHPESRHWFIEVKDAAANYIAELGYYQPGNQWTTVAGSNPAATPPDTPAPDRTVQFARLPEEPIAATETSRSAHIQPALVPPRVEWLPALEERRSQPSTIPHPPSTIREWTPAQERALAEIIGLHSMAQPSVSSLEITEWVRREIQQEIAARQFGQPWPIGEQPVSSPMGGPPPRLKAFWFNLNAELIIYGATEPGTAVTIAGQPIELRPDGSFTCRFAFPDGEYDLEVAATSVENETRQAQLKFTRRTETKMTNAE